MSNFTSGGETDLAPTGAAGRPVAREPRPEPPQRHHGEGSDRMTTTLDTRVAAVGRTTEARRTGGVCSARSAGSVSSPA